jgi:hypothetical protein
MTTRYHIVCYEFHLNSRSNPAKTTLQRYPSSYMVFRRYTVSQMEKRAVLKDGSAHEGNTEKEKKGHVVIKFKDDVNGFSSISDPCFKGSSAFTV